MQNSIRIHYASKSGLRIYQSQGFLQISFYFTAELNKAIKMVAVTAKTRISKKQRILKALLLTAGTICLTLGAIGIFVPLLPATPFLLIAAACYMRSSERMYNWLLNNRWCGSYVKNYREGKGIPLKTKIIAIAFLWAAILYSTIMVVNEVLVAQLVLFIVACAVSIHLVRIPTFKRTCNVD